ncbi:hypothetical protein OCU04_012039 [Sclerotinia nivalis]|uniref:Uncharacterized protein n=1 Tax=Sclerotinia nivalis TaxID=352851 RepID=A0A9X0AAA8_9HELO|nr:hypothetical protein OCU04_012039 [Sclerotinia nivalis]
MVTHRLPFPPTPLPEFRVLHVVVLLAQPESKLQLSANQTDFRQLVERKHSISIE